MKRFLFLYFNINFVVFKVFRDIYVGFFFLLNVWLIFLYSIVYINGILDDIFDIKYWIKSMVGLFKCKFLGYIFLNDD